MKEWSIAYDKLMRWNVAWFAVLMTFHIVAYLLIPKTSTLAMIGNPAQGLALLLAAIQFSRAIDTAEKGELGNRILIALGLWIWLMAHALLAYSELLLGKPASGTVTDIVWLFGYALITRSLYLMLNRTLTRQAAIRRHLVLLVLIGFIVLAALHQPLSKPEPGAWLKIIQFIFPFLDLWIAAVALMLGSQTGTRNWMLAGFGSLIIGISDLIFPYFYTGDSPVYRYLDIPLFAGYSLWWLQGAFLQIRPQHGKPANRS